jgi:hypothetical protein
MNQAKLWASCVAWTALVHLGTVACDSKGADGTASGVADADSTSRRHGGDGTGGANAGSGSSGGNLGGTATSGSGSAGGTVGGTTAGTGSGAGSNGGMGGTLGSGGSSGLGGTPGSGGRRGSGGSVGGSGSGGRGGAGGATGSGGTTSAGGASGTGTGGLSGGLGAHALGYHRAGGNSSPASTPAMNTRSSGGTMIVGVGRGDISAFALPSDNKGNSPYTQLGATHPYSLWTSSGTALYAFPSLVGGSGHVVTTTTPPGDEITIAAVEVLGRKTIRAFKWNEVLAGNPLTSLSVTTTGPATLVAFWWGDADVGGDKTAVPNNGFAVIDSILLSGLLVQGAVAAKDVSAAGSYTVTWAATPVQGAQMWLVAVE